MITLGEGNGTPLQYSCLENPMDGGVWWAAVYGVAQSWTRLKRLSSSNDYILGFPGGMVEKKNMECRRCQRLKFDIPGLRFPGIGNGNSLLYSCLENFMDRGAWKATVHVVRESWLQLRDWAHTYIDVLFLESWSSSYLAYKVIEKEKENIKQWK